LSKKTQLYRLRIKLPRSLVVLLLDRIREIRVVDEFRGDPTVELRSLAYYSTSHTTKHLPFTIHY